MSNQEEDAALAALLDDALQGFTTKQGSTAQVAPSDRAEASGAVPTDIPPPSSNTAPTTSSSSTAKAAPKGLGFDPLKGRTKVRKPSTNDTVPPPSQPNASNQQQLDDADRVAGLSKLLEELAGQGPPPPDNTTTATTAHQQQNQDNLTATLRALAEQQSSLGGGSQHQFPAGLGGLGLGGGAGGFNEDMTPEEEAAFFASLTQQLQGLAGGSGAEGGEEGDMPGMTSLVDTIMAQLLSKDVLYQPMKDIGAKYPEWLAANESKLPPEELAHYKEQYEYINKMCALYENDPNNFGELVNLLQEMQQRGQPPQEIVDELAPGSAFSPEGVLGGSGGGIGGCSGPPPDCCIQ